MQTPTHLIIGIAAFGRKGDWRVNTAALFGGFLPDASLYLMVIWHLKVLRTPPQVVFDELYFSDAWQSIFAIDNSFFIWGAVLAVALIWKNAILTAFAGAGLLHLALDFPLHHDDGRPHFWPLTNWVFNSPVSYWDPSAYGLYVAIIELILVLGLLYLLAKRFGWRSLLKSLLVVLALVIPLGLAMRFL